MCYCIKHHVLQKYMGNGNIALCILYLMEMSCQSNTLAALLLQKDPLAPIR
jgi:hypothetical protein